MVYSTLPSSILQDFLAAVELCKEQIESDDSKCVYIGWMTLKRIAIEVFDYRLVSLGLYKYYCKEIIESIEAARKVAKDNKELEKQINGDWRLFSYEYE